MTQHAPASNSQDAPIPRKANIHTGFMRYGQHAILIACLFGALATTVAAPIEEVAGLPTTTRAALAPPPGALVQKFNLSPFYRKHLQLGGFPLLASINVPDNAMLVASEIVSGMLSKRPDILDGLGASHIRLAVMGRNELTVDIPEHSDLQPAAFWNQRARGLGPTLARPAISCAEENLLELPDDRYKGESICVHEFAHAIELELSRSSAGFLVALQACYQNAKLAGLWTNTYGAENATEYWAEGVQSYFDANQRRDASHNGVRTREQLAKYDPALFALIDERLASPLWRYRARRG